MARGDRGGGAGRGRGRVLRRAAGMGVRLRFSEADPGQVTGYSVGLTGQACRDGAVAWYGGGRLAAGLTLPRLREQWAAGVAGAPERSGAFRLTASERDVIWAHAARQAAAAAERIRWCAGRDPAAAADAAWAAADTLHVAARALGSPALGCAADAYDRAARAPHGRVPGPSRDGSGCGPRPGWWRCWGTLPTMARSCPRRPSWSSLPELGRHSALAGGPRRADRHPDGHAQDGAHRPGSPGRSSAMPGRGSGSSAVTPTSTSRCAASPALLQRRRGRVRRSRADGHARRIARHYLAAACGARLAAIAVGPVTRPAPGPLSPAERRALG